MIYWIGHLDTGHLGIIPPLKGGKRLKSEIDALSMNEVDVVVSLLEPKEIKTLNLSNEACVCSEKGIYHYSFPIPNRGIPYSSREVATFVKELNAYLERNQKVVIHCRKSIGRSAMMAASVLVMQGVTADTAFEQIEVARQKNVPNTQEQINWVKEFKAISQL